ncbi:leucine--tRNA ligase [Scheffersomyces xylosifermentans]|uniref:leucine--tRNA ligase n=1 Tax=Scheffersomyces xylosifermentans TaxID=1304137 RepID=UPI00315DA0FA
MIRTGRTVSSRFRLKGENFSQFLGSQNGKFSLFSRANSSTSNQKLDLTSLDAKWSERWRQESPDGSLHPTKHLVDEDAEKFYSLSMFPYPSGSLHLGHLRVYTISDVVARFKRLKGYNVIHPMGWDAFGLPAENAAVERGINPADWTESNIAKMKEQMQSMLADFDWDRELSTCSPEYYKWTQKIFLLLFEHGLAYRKEAEINWDPVDQTVLANEQVDAEGRSWRSGAIVEKKNLEQWFIGITEYAEALNRDLKTLDQWPDKVKAMQRHWIGESHGAEISFATTDPEIKKVTVFTSRPDTLFSVQFLAISLNHPLAKKIAARDESLASFIQNSRDTTPDSKDGHLLTGVKVSIPIDPLNKRIETYDIPIYVAPYVLDTYGHGAVMGCPAHDERDFEFWKLHNPNVDIIQVVGESDIEVAKKRQLDSPFTSKEGVIYDNSVLGNGLENLGTYHGKTTKQAAKEIVNTLEKFGVGSKSTQYRIRDWLISRQRYWGAPIPIVHCDSCGPVAVPDEELPVLLPKIEGSKFGKGNPLNNLESFVETKCPSCGSHARRETDTMDTFIDSSWYFFRYLDSKNTSEPFNHDIATKNMPVDMYIGGVEHAILHLLYTRFISKFLADAGLWNSIDVANEPIKRLVTQGMVHGKTYTDPETGRFLKPDEVDVSGEEPKILSSGLTPNISYEKMSKSKYNGADPGDCIKKYGADAVRAQMLFSAPVSDVLNWNEEQIQGVDRWLRKVIALEGTISEVLNSDEYNPNERLESIKLENFQLCGEQYESLVVSQVEFGLLSEVQSYLQRISKSIEVDLSFNTVISDLMKLTNSIINTIKLEEQVNPRVLLDSYRKLLVAMSSITPCTAEECWERLNKTLGNDPKSIFHEKYPISQTIESPFTNFNIFVNGKARHSFKAKKSLAEESQDKVLEEILKFEAISKVVDPSTINKVIIKPGMISIVTKKN